MAGHKPPDDPGTNSSAEATLNLEIDRLFDLMMQADSSSERHAFSDAMAAAARGRSVRLQLKMFAKLKDLTDE